LETIDFLIVGQGLAGSVLAYTLHQRGVSVRIVADDRPSSTAVAAGIYNPITGRKLVKTWKGEVLFPFLKNFYRSVESHLGTQFLHESAVYRPFRNPQEQIAYLKQCADPDIAPFVDTQPNNTPYESWVNNELGGIQTTTSGWLDTQRFLQKMRIFFQAQNLFYPETFDHQEVRVDQSGLSWKNHRIGQIIFCEGVSATHNPWFGWLPFSPVRGELLHLRIPSVVSPGIVNQGVWLLPVGEGVFKLGATYEWDNLTWEPTPEARTYLEAKLGNWLKTPYEVLGQSAGIRPATADRRPFVGLHPEHKGLGIFNGLGSKGVSLAPYLAQEFADFLLLGKELDPEVNIERYFSLYYSANLPRSTP
jgi:glycine/D-amino acid oxidase-like deaminating enzyme